MAGHANYRITLDMYVGTTAGVLDRARTATQCGRSRYSQGRFSRYSPGPGLYLFYLMFSFPVGMTRPGLLFGR